jgi:hypothetical protein
MQDEDIAVSVLTQDSWCVAFQVTREAVIRHGPSPLVTYRFSDWKGIWADIAENQDAVWATTALASQITMNNQMARVFAQHQPRLGAGSWYALRFPGDSVDTMYDVGSVARLDQALLTAIAVCIDDCSLDHRLDDLVLSTTTTVNVPGSLHACVLLHDGAYCGHLYAIVHEDALWFFGMRVAFDYLLRGNPAKRAMHKMLNGLVTLAQCRRCSKLVTVMPTPVQRAALEGHYGFVSASHIALPPKVAALIGGGNMSTTTWTRSALAMFPISTAGTIIFSSAQQQQEHTQ